MTDFDLQPGLIHRGLGIVARWPGLVMVIPSDPVHDAAAEQMLNELGPDPTSAEVRQIVVERASQGTLRAVAYVAHDPIGLIGFAFGPTEVVRDGQTVLNGASPVHEQAIGPSQRLTIRAANLSKAAEPAAPFNLRLGVAPGAGITLVLVDDPNRVVERPTPVADHRHPAGPVHPDGDARSDEPLHRDGLPPVARPVPPQHRPDGPDSHERPTGSMAPPAGVIEPFVSILLGRPSATPVAALPPLAVARPPAVSEGPAGTGTGPLGHPAPSHRLPPLSGNQTADDNALVQGILCSRHHFNNPAAAFCMVCGISMVHVTHNLVPGSRPTLGFVVFDNGSTFGLDRSYIVGREPGHPAEPNTDALTIHDDNETLSRRHAEIRLIDWEVHIVDLGSTNGTFVWDVTFQRWNQIAPRQPIALSPGDTVALGRRTFVYESVTRL
jgi:hypothetical protein